MTRDFFQIYNSSYSARRGSPENTMAELGDTSAVAEADLDDFMDIVTVFKCKFCDFSCNDRTGMSNHVRSYHIGKI